MIRTYVSGLLYVGGAPSYKPRRWVMWKDSRLVHILLLLFALGHWTILVLGKSPSFKPSPHYNLEIDAANIKAFNSNGACVIHLAHPGVTAGVFMYSKSYCRVLKWVPFTRCVHLSRML